MKQKKKGMPVWLPFLIDLFIIAAYVIGFYEIYYLSPRELISTGVKTVQAETASSDVTVGANSETASGKETNTDAEIASDKEADTDTEIATDTDHHFTDMVVSAAASYSSPGISITIEKCTEGSGKDIVTYYVADIYVSDITSIQSGFAEQTYGVGYTDTVLEMDQSLNAILAMNGDYYGNGGNGVVIRNGEVYRSSTSGSDVCVLYYDGTMKTYSAGEFDIDQAVEEGAWQVWSFGPELLDDNGNSIAQFTTDGHISRSNPRSAIGYYEPGHYCMVVVDGRQSGYSAGMTLTQLSQLFEKLGCKAAYNLDGGKSSEITFNDTTVNQPADGGREVSDCIIIKEAE